MKTRKLLSIVMAVMMLLGCCSLSSFAIDWPKEVAAGAVTVKGITTLSSVEIPVSAEFTAVASDAEFKVYYSAENIGDDIFAIANLEEKGTIGANNAYLAESVLHINLAGLELAEEGYYYISIASGSLVCDGYYSIATVTDGVLYQYASLDVGGKISAFFDYIISLITNILSNGKSY